MQGVKGLAMCVGRESGSPVSGEETRMQGERLTAWLEEQAAAIDAAGLPGTDAARAAAADVCAEKARLLPVWKEQARTQRVPLKGTLATMLPTHTHTHTHTQTAVDFLRT